MSKVRWYLKVRRYPEAKFVSVWVVRADGPAEASLLWGEVLPGVVAQLAEATGLPVEEESSPLPAVAMVPPGCLPFGEGPPA